MEDKDFKKLIETLEANVEPAAGIQQKILNEIIQRHESAEKFILTPVEKFFYERPLRAACAVSAVISGVLWAIFGNGYAFVLSNLIAGR